MKEKTLEQRLWDAADKLRANSKLRAVDYAEPVLGLIFLRFADFKFQQVDMRLREGRAREDSRAMKMRERTLTPEDYQARGIIYLPKIARYSYLLNLPEDKNYGRAINEAMKVIEETNPSLKGALPKSFTKLDNSVLVELLRNFAGIQFDIEGDKFGKIYEYFLGKFAMSEGRKGGEFFTPTPIVKLIVQVIEPFRGRVFDPACGSGGMFVQSFNFIRHRQKKGNDASKKIMIYGQEKEESTVGLCKMNLAVHGLEGEIKNANTYYANVFKEQRFDFVMANPPFNVNGVEMDKLKDDPRFSFGLPRTDNANYIWIQQFLYSLNQKGRAGFVMANAASDSRSSELEIRKKLIESGVVDIMISIGPKFFYTVTLSCTLWFFDKAKTKTNRRDKILLIDARNIFTKIDSAHHEFTDEQIQKIANIAWKYRNEKGAGKYKDVKGLCKVATLDEIKDNNYSLTPGRYVGVALPPEPEYDFEERLTELNDELNRLTQQARKIEPEIDKNIKQILA
ncbi:N-6 DNA methylase [candidate division WOR-3 bacterium]|nr:N-6 DNA methylase [candidate division WOR-3 bacterium]